MYALLRAAHAVTVLVLLVLLLAVTPAVAQVNQPGVTCANQGTSINFSPIMNCGSGTTCAWSAPGVCTITASGGGGTITNIATTTPITGGPITTTGTLACPTCVTGGTLTAGRAVIGAGGQGVTVTNALAVTNLNAGTNAGAATFWRGDGTWAPPGSSPLTTSNALQVSYPNEGSVGTTTGLITKIINDPPVARNITTSDTVGLAFGICASNCSTTGTGLITVQGFASCQFDGGTVALDYVVPSITSAGKCHDAGASYPTGITVLGRVQSTNVGAGTYDLSLFLNDVAAATSGGNGRGTTVTINSSGVSSNNGDFNDTSPAPSASQVNVAWQKANGNPSSISANVSFASPLTKSGATLGCTTCVTSASALTNGQLLAGGGSQGAAVTNLTGDVTTSGGVATTLSVVNKRRVCAMIVGSDNGSVLANADLGPQGRQCFVPAPSTVVEVNVAGDAGTPNVITGRNRAGSIVNLTSSALATASAGGIACSNTGGTTGLNGTTTCSNTLQNTGLNAGDYLELVSGTAGGVAKRMSIFVILTVN